MIRLIISFYLMLLLSLGIFLVGFMTTMSLALPEPFFTGTNEKLAKGTLNLLNDEFNKLDSDQIEPLLKKYQYSFDTGLDLLDITELSYFPPSQSKKLKSGEIVFEVIENPTFMERQVNAKEQGNRNYSFYYLKQASRPKVWRINFDLDEDGSFPLPRNDDEAPPIFSSTFITGMMVVIQSRLLAETTISGDINTALKAVQTRFGLPIQIIDADNIELLAFKHKSSSLQIHNPFSGRLRHPVYRFNEKNGNLSILQPLDNNTKKVIKVGPFKVSWFTQHIETLILFAMILGLLSTFFLGIWPLWSNLMKIKKSADSFGKGDYSARVSTGKFSPIKSISKAFNSMAEQTQDTIRAHKELTSGVSHELRTPIARMHFSLETLEQATDEAEKIESINSIKEDMTELNSLIDELLHYARYDHKGVEISRKKTNLSEWFNLTLARLEPLSNNKKLIYSSQSVNKEVQYAMDSRLLSRVLDNLVQNALRYAQYQVIVTLSKDKDSYLLHVEDDGEGIPKNKRLQVFEAFSRIDNSRNRSTGGYGLGLAIVERIISAHGGSVVLSEPQQLSGAHFVVKLPIS